MSTLNGDNAAAHELELVVSTELTLAEVSQSEVEVDGVPTADWPADPEAQRYETYLRTLLGAVEALDDGSGSGDRLAQSETGQATGPFGDGRD